MDEIIESDPQILAILDDNLDDVLFMGKQLQEHYSILKFTDIQKFHDAMMTCRPDVLILDYRLYDDGENCLKIISRYKHRIPVIMVVTGMYDDKQVILSCYKAGAMSVLDKNNPKEIKRQIAGLWRSRTRLIQRRETQVMRA